MPLISPILDKLQSHKMHSAAAEALGHIGNASSVLPLAIAARETTLEFATHPALEKLLPLIQPGHYPDVSKDLTPALTRLLTEAEGNLVLELLKALQRAGNGSAVEPIERLLISSRYNENSAIREAMDHALVVLRDRREKEQNAERLLRPSDAPGENLLRPAGAVTTPDDELLRPIQEVKA